MVAKLAEADRDRLGTAVAAAEGQTSAEIVLVVNQACDDYGTAPWIWAAAVGFLFAGSLAVFFPDMHVRVAFLMTSVVVLVATLVLHLPALRVALTPAPVKRDQAARAAREHFASQVAGRTAGANGLLIFVALSEHYVEIIPDAGIARVIPESIWTDIIAALLDQVRRGHLAQGLCDAVTKCTAVLVPAFPPHRNDKDEIPNGIIFNEG